MDESRFSIISETDGLGELFKHYSSFPLKKPIEQLRWFLGVNQLLVDPFLPSFLKLPPRTISSSWPEYNEMIVHLIDNEFISFFKTMRMETLELNRLHSSSTVVDGLLSLEHPESVQQIILGDCSDFNFSLLSRFPNVNKFEMGEFKGKEKALLASQLITSSFQLETLCFLHLDVEIVKGLRGVGSLSSLARLAFIHSADETKKEEQSEAVCSLVETLGASLGAIWFDEHALNLQKVFVSCAKKGLRVFCHVINPYPILSALLHPSEQGLILPDLELIFPADFDVFPVDDSNTSLGDIALHDFNLLLYLLGCQWQPENGLKIGQLCTSGGLENRVQKDNLFNLIRLGIVIDSLVLSDFVLDNVEDAELIAGCISEATITRFVIKGITSSALFEPIKGAIRRRKEETGKQLEFDWLCKTYLDKAMLDVIFD